MDEKLPSRVDPKTLGPGIKHDFPTYNYTHQISDKPEASPYALNGVTVPAQGGHKHFMFVNDPHNNRYTLEAEPVTNRISPSGVPMGPGHSFQWHTNTERMRNMPPLPDFVRQGAARALAQHMDLHDRNMLGSIGHAHPFSLLDVQPGKEGVQADYANHHYDKLELSEKSNLKSMSEKKLAKGLSPWDVESSAPPPPPRPAPKGSAKAMWAGRPILDPKHTRDLDTDAAINEFSLKMPRQKAEDKAYNSYQTRHRTEAAAHHLKLAQVARAAGDLDSASKHGMMYNLHAKAIGHDPAQGMHPAIADLMNEFGPGGIVKFKPHKADSFAIEDHHKSPDANLNNMPGGAPPVISSAGDPRLGKSEQESLHVLWKATKALTEKAKPCWCKAYGHPHRVGGGTCKEKEAKAREEKK